MKTKFSGLLSWKRSGSSSFSLNKFNRQANKDWAQNSYAGCRWPGSRASLSLLGLPCSPSPRRAKQVALGWCKVGQGQQEFVWTGTLQDRLLFFCILCWLDSKFEFINPVSLWLLNQSGFKSCSVHWHKSCLCSQSWVIIFEEAKELKSIGFSALKSVSANDLVFSVEEIQQLSNLCAHFCTWNMISCC